MQRARINMFANKDKNDQTYYLGKLHSPITINFKDGVAFILYPNDENEEDETAELHFCPIDNPDVSDVFKYYKSRRTNPNRTKYPNLPVELSIRYEKDPLPGFKARPFYIGKVQFDGFINCADGVFFLAFVSDKNEEELQIAVVDPEKEHYKNIKE